MLQRQNKEEFLHRIITGDEMLIYYDNSKRLKAYINPGHRGRLSQKRNIHCFKVMLCIWWDRKCIVYYEFLQPGTTINAQVYKEQLTQFSLELYQKFA